MSELVTEDEQVEIIKKWFKENGTSLITGLLLGVSAVVGFRGWVDYQDEQTLEAANKYTQVIQAIEENQVTDVTQIANKLVSDHGRTPYAALAELAMAKVSMDAGNVAAAQVHLRWAMENAKPEVFQHIARQRLIRILLSEGALDEVDTLLLEAAGTTVGKDSFGAGYRALKGDLLLARGDYSGAVHSYQSAIDGLPRGSDYRVLLELKRDDSKSMFAGE